VKEPIMVNDQAYVYGEHGSNSAVKLIADPGSVRLKVCRLHEDGRINDRVGETMEVALNRDGLNRTIKELRRLRDRVYGKDE
jgi:hypothetical protein